MKLPLLSTRNEELKVSVKGVLLLASVKVLLISCAQAEKLNSPVADTILGRMNIRPMEMPTSVMEDMIRNRRRPAIDPLNF